MIDIKFLRENPDVVKENIKKKFQDHKLVLVDEVIALDQQYRKETNRSKITSKTWSMYSCWNNDTKETKLSFT